MALQAPLFEPPILRSIRLEEWFTLFHKFVMKKINFIQGLTKCPEISRTFKSTLLKVGFVALLVKLGFRQTRLNPAIREVFSQQES